MRVLYRYALWFAWGFFFVLGVLAILHALARPPRTIEQAFAISILGGFGGLVVRRRLDQVQAHHGSAPPPGARGPQNRSR